MRKINIIAGFLIGLFCLSSCDKFLNLTPRDTKVVSSIEDYRDIMASYMYWLKTPNRNQMTVFGVGSFVTPALDQSANLGIYTGETNLSTVLSYYYDKSKDEYTTNAKKLLTWLMTDPYAWNQYYDFVGPINMIISGIATATGNDEDLRNYVKGEALVWRAFTYYKLLQYYAPYKDNKYGVPVYLTPDQDIGNAMPARKTQEEVFAQILDDCEQALGLLEKTATNEWNCAYRNDFIQAMMASIYSWKAMSGAAEATDWQQAEKYATEAMKGRRMTNSAEVLKEIFNCKDVTPSTTLENDEFYFRIMDGDKHQVGSFKTGYYEDVWGSMTDGRVNEIYYSKFRDGDIRKIAWFNEAGTYSDKYNLMGGSEGCCFILFRLAEMYLIKAEALVRMGKAGEARIVLEEFDQARYTVPVDIPSAPEALLQEILDERIREFYMENDFRWLDMKRLGIQLQRTIKGETFTLQPDDFRYCFPIPKRELELNKNMVQTPGWEKVML